MYANEGMVEEKVEEEEEEEEEKEKEEEEGMVFANSVDTSVDNCHGKKETPVTRRVNEQHRGSWLLPRVSAPPF